MEGYDTLHDLLVKLFNEIMNIEEKAIITEEFKDISNNDMHIIEAIGLDEPQQHVICGKGSVCHCGNR